MCNKYTLKVKLHPMRSSGFHGICKIKVIREHSFFRRGGGEEFREGSLTFYLPEKGGSS